MASPAPGSRHACSVRSQPGARLPDVVIFGAGSHHAKYKASLESFEAEIAALHRAVNRSLLVPQPVSRRAGAAPHSRTSSGAGVRGAVGTTWGLCWAPP